MKSRPAVIRQFLLALVLGIASGAGTWFLINPGAVFFRIVFAIVGAIIGFLVGANINLRRGSDSLPGDKVGSSGSLLRKQVLLMIDEQRSRLENAAFKLKDDRVRLCTDDLVRSYHALAGQIKEDISDARPVRRFLNHYGESAVTIVEKYLQLDNLPASMQTESSAKATDNIVSTLTDMKGAFEVLQKRLIENDLFSIETELEVLQKSMGLDGLSNQQVADRHKTGSSTETADGNGQH